MDNVSLIKEFQRLVDSIHIESEDIDYSILNHHIRLLDRISMVENSSLTVFDMFQKKYVFIRSRFKDILGYDEQMASEEGFSYFFKLMHPDDLPMVIETTTMALSFMNECPALEKQNYKTVFEHRLRVISVNTVNNHRQNIIRKMGLSNTSEAIAYAQKIGIV